VRFFFAIFVQVKCLVTWITITSVILQTETLHFLSGVIQGSSIGPLMFLIFINELIHVLEKLGIKVKLFADDAKLYLRVTDENDIIKLQAALDSLSNGLLLGS